MEAFKMGVEATSEAFLPCKPTSGQNSAAAATSAAATTAAATDSSASTSTSTTTSSCTTCSSSPALSASLNEPIGDAEHFFFGSSASTSTLSPLARMSMVGHRGCSASAPENTLASMKLAFERGADGVEFDVQRSKDGAIFLLHDSTLRRTADPTCPTSLLERGCSQEEYLTMLDIDVSELSYEAFIRHVPVGVWRPSEGLQEEVQYPCLMTEVMSILPKGKYVLCEVKGGDQASAKAVAQLVEEQGWTSEQLKFIGFDLELMIELKNDLTQRCLDYVPVIFLKDVVSEQDAIDTVKVAHQAGLDGVDFQADADMVTAKVVDAALFSGLCIGVWVWDVLPLSDTVETASVLRDIGVQFYTSDLPSSMCRWMTEDALN